MLRDPVWDAFPCTIIYYERIRTHSVAYILYIWYICMVAVHSGALEERAYYKLTRDIHAPECSAFGRDHTYTHILY